MSRSDLKFVRIPNVTDKYEFRRAMISLKSQVRHIEYLVEHDLISPRDKKIHIEEVRKFADFMKKIAPKYANKK